MPLSIVGLEGVWYNALRKIGYTDQEARDYLVGPAYFAWQWMTNLESFAGPLPKSWIDSHVKLAAGLSTANWNSACSPSNRDIRVVFRLNSRRNFLMPIYR